ncbi:MAG TPA: hypothetical protein VNO32_09855, partial [Candidatus Acidoferrum sp.]|nr:hypothetical protein [Candidatus Acidoferrum sp.]
MRRVLFLFCLAATCLAASVSSSQSCEPTSFARKVLEQLRLPDDAHLPAVQRQEVKLGILRKALSVSPADIFLNEAYQSVSLAEIEVNRPPLIAQYDALVEKHPDDPVFLYLAANAETGRNSKQAIAHLQRAIELAPSFGLPRLLLARIYLSRVYEDAAQMNDQLEGFAKVCPSSVRALTNLRWNKDKDLLKREATRLRRNIEARTDSEAVAAYPILWSFEAALERSDQQSGNQLRVQHDIHRLQGKQFVRNSAWLDAIESAGSYDGIADDVVLRASHEIAVLFPKSDSTLHEKYRQAIADAPCPKNGTAEQNTDCARYTWRALMPLIRD